MNDVFLWVESSLKCVLPVGLEARTIHHLAEPRQYGAAASSWPTRHLEQVQALPKPPSSQVSHVQNRHYTYGGPVALMRSTCGHYHAVS